MAVGLNFDFVPVAILLGIVYFIFGQVLSALSLFQDSMGQIVYGSIGMLFGLIIIAALLKPIFWPDPTQTM